MTLRRHVASDVLSVLSFGRWTTVFSARDRDGTKAFITCLSFARLADVITLLDSPLHDATANGGFDYDQLRICRRVRSASRRICTPARSEDQIANISTKLLAFE